MELICREEEKRFGKEGMNAYTYAPTHQHTCLLSSTMINMTNVVAFSCHSLHSSETSNHKRVPGEPCAFAASSRIARHFFFLKIDAERRGTKVT